MHSPTSFHPLGYTTLICCTISILAAFLWPPLQIFSLQSQRNDTYSIRILSFDPLMIYIINFVPEEERRHFLEAGYVLPCHSDYTRLISNSRDLFTRSTVDTGKGTVVSRLDSSDPMVKRIMSRASAFQGYTSSQDHEPLQMTRYSVGQEYKPHWDHRQNESVPRNETQRITTFFAILEATCETCGTRFPDLKVDWSKEDARWCHFVDCSDHDGITIRPIPGNALFWKNLDNSGAGDPRTLHAGLPPLTGVKTGLNIWTRTPRITE
jgi:prolyl 4-hydroxylase